MSHVTCTSCTSFRFCKCSFTANHFGLLGSCISRNSHLAIRISDLVHAINTRLHREIRVRLTGISLG